eukprot:1377817-Amphidinium_carterae.1
MSWEHSTQRERLKKRGQDALPLGLGKICGGQHRAPPSDLFRTPPNAGIEPAKNSAQNRRCPPKGVIEKKRWWDNPRLE